MRPLKRILVTGGAGFIGSHTVELLLNHHKEVIVLDNLCSGKKHNLDLTHQHLKFIEGNILDYQLVKESLSHCDAVLHLAAIVSVQKTIEDPIYSFQVNAQGHLHILQAIRELNRPIRFVYVSSAAVYGNNKQLPCQDTEPLPEAPTSPYALQKINNEEYAQLFSSLYGTNSQALRYFNVYGPRQDPSSPYSGVISRFLAAYQQGEALTIFGDGKQTRDFIHVTDVAKANYLALTCTEQKTVNIATGQPQDLLTLIQYMEAAGGKKAKISFAPARAGDIYHSYASTDLAARLLHFQYSIPLQQGMQELVQQGTEIC